MYFDVIELQKEKNVFFINYRTQMTDIYGKDYWIDRHPFKLNSVKNFDDLKEYAMCFNIVYNVLQKRRENKVFIENDPFEFYKNEEIKRIKGIENIHFFNGVGVLFIMKNGNEHSIGIEIDKGCHSENGNCFEGVELINYIYIDENEVKFIIYPR